MDPWIATLYSIPIIAIVPLIIIWFGIGMISKVIVVFKITAVAIILNTSAGIKNLDPVWLELAKSLRLSGWKTTYKIRLPGALPYIITGMRHGLAACRHGLTEFQSDQALRTQNGPLAPERGMVRRVALGESRTFYPEDERTHRQAHFNFA
jgi:hypothetical protein